MRSSEIRARLAVFNREALPREIDGWWRNLSRFRDMAYGFRDIPGLSDIVEGYLNSPVFQSPSDRLQGIENPGQINYLNIQFERAVLSLRELLDAIQPPTNATTISVLLPPGTDFKTVIADQEAIQKALSQSLFENVEGSRVEIVGWENGSLWLYLDLGIAKAVALVGGMLWAAAVIRMKRLEGDLLQETARSYRIKNEVAEHLRDKVKQEVEATIDAETLALYEKHVEGKPDPERLKRLRYSLETLCNLLMRGAEIHPSLMAPEEAKNVFPTYSELDTIASRIPQLKESSEKREETD